MSAFFNLIGNTLRDIRHRASRSLGRLAFGCLLLFFLLAAMCGLLAAFLVERAGAAPSPPTTAPLCAYVVLDESVSNGDLGGVGSDPSGLRHQAPRLLISYLGIDAAQDASPASHRVALVHFGTSAQLTVPLTALDAAGRAALLAQLTPPEPLGWTDHRAALTLALDDAATRAGECVPIIILFTDGKSDWDDATAIDRDAYVAALRLQGQRLADMGGRLFIVLLANEATDADPEIAAVWKPLWQEMAAGTAAGRFYEVRRPEDLMGVYHEIVATLTGHVAAPPVIDVTAAATPSHHSVTVESGLDGLTLVIAKSDPGVVARVFLPDGRRLEPSLPGVRHVTGAGVMAEELWSVEAPPPGRWVVEIFGQGRVLVWKDVRAADVVATVTRPSPTPAPSATPLPTASVAVLVLRPPTAAPLASPQATRVPLVPTPATVTVVASAGEDRGLPWLLGLLPPAVTIGALVWLRKRQQPLTVAGTLHVLGGASEDRIDLEALRRRQITVGAAPADVALPTAGRFALVPRRAGRATEITLRALDVTTGPALTVNGRPAVPNQPLRDMDVIRSGDLRLRYENLALRPAEAWPDRADDLEPFGY